MRVVHSDQLLVVCCTQYEGRCLLVLNVYLLLSRMHVLMRVVIVVESRVLQTNHGESLLNRFYHILLMIPMRGALPSLIKWCRLIAFLIRMELVVDATLGLRSLVDVSYAVGVVMISI